MSDTITVTFKVMEDGSLQKISQGAEAAAKSTDKATKSSDNYGRKQKGVAGISSNSTKNFSKMTMGITDGLVPAYATLAANVFALTAAFGVLSRNDAIAKLEEGLEFTGRAAGRNLTLVADKLKEITDNAISAEQAMRTTAVGVSAGFTQQQMEGLAKVAKGAALALGRDMGDAMDRLTRGAAKLEPEILDELGIMVRLDDAVRDYALAHNKATSELTQFERRMAFTNAIIDDGIGKYAALAESLDPSAYAQLSASFSDLTKTFVYGINTFFGPLLSFLAATPVAVAALAATFGASLTGQIIGGLEGMARSSAEASKATKDMVGESLKGVKAHEKLGKAFNEVANGASRGKTDLDRMMKSLNMTINMTSKDIEKLKIATKARNQLTKEIHLQDIAQAKSTHSTALSTMQTHGLGAAAKIQAQAFRELAVAHTTATATTTGFATAGVYARTVTTGFAMSVRFLGAAFLTAMPYIAAILAAFSILSPMFKSLFGDTTKLGKAIDINNERFEEFAKVSAQYSTSIGHAKTETEAWIATLKPVAGMLTEVSTALDTALAAAQADQIISLANATIKLKNAQEGYAKSSKGSGTFAGVQDFTQIINAQAEINKGGALAEETMQLLKESAIKGSASINVALNQMKEALLDSGVEGQRALSVINTEQQAVADAFQAFASSNGGLEAYTALSTAIRTASQSANAAVNAFETMNETIKKAKELVGDTEATLGPYAQHLDNLREAINKVNAVAGKSGDAAEEAKKILEAYGFTSGKDPVGQLTLFEAAIADINTKLQENAMAFSDLQVEKALGGRTIELLREELKLQSDKTTLALREVGIAAVNTQQKIDKQTAFNAELAKEIELRNKLFAAYAKDAEASGMGQAASAAIGLEAGVMAASGDEKKELQGEQARASLAGLAKDMAALGPEGALMSSTIQGALNMETAFTTAFSVMSEEGASTSTKIQAGLGAVGAAVSAIGAMQQAASAQKIAAIDNEIAAEKARDGKSAGSVAKLAALEKKKESAKRKAFEMDKKMKMAQTVIGTAQGVVSMLGAAPPPVNFALAGMVAAMGAAQLGMISGMTFQGGGSGAAAAVPTSISAGSRGSSVDLAKSQSASGELGYLRGQSGVGGAENFKPAFSGYKHRAAGGYVVGEQGPELFMPEVPGQIIPAGAGMGGTTNVNFSIQAVDAQGVEDLLVRQRGNIIGMMREAANSYGQDFMEGIDTSIYTPSSAGATKY